jgi:PTH2 family peptidyl-tRNA hydrolase
MADTKQVIVMRTDLNMRKGKMVAQGSHASLGAVLRIQDEGNHDWTAALSEWLDSSFKKICVGVDSDTTLLELKAALDAAGLPCKLVTDLGHTEFHGKPTVTCLAVGPYYSDVIDRFTGGLRLL